MAEARAARNGRLAGRVALVTGGGRGIGRAIALELAREGAKVAVSSRTPRELEAVVKEVEALGSQGFAVRADALSRDETKSAVESVIAHFGHLDGLVNNAGGVIAPRGLEELLPFTHDDHLFETNLRLNLTSAYWATRYALPHMRDRGFGRVITIGSGYAKRSGGMIAYSAAKHGLIGLTRALAAQVAPFGITVNCLCPGWTNTSLVDWDVLAVAYGTTPSGAKQLAESENLQHRILEPEELGPMAALLLSEEAKGITGQVISVDGGYKV
ncbi:MAG TPA: SDR family NAD(P)-dependent oxidoreductase [Myxococcota bacterium]|nr:SDR family NAD(P)-dependent oxidoreductase [Myxococcota bacterium]